MRECLTRRLGSVEHVALPRHHRLGQEEFEDFWERSTS